MRSFREIESEAEDAFVYDRYRLLSDLLPQVLGAMDDLVRLNRDPAGTPGFQVHARRVLTSVETRLDGHGGAA